MTTTYSLPQEPIFELEGDLGPLTRSTNPPSSSQPSLKPKPLNFSRPRRTTQTDQADQADQANQADDTSSRVAEPTRAPSVYSIDDAVPPPIGRGHTQHDSFDLDKLSIADSIDEAIPPPIKVRPVTAGPLQANNHHARAASSTTPRADRAPRTLTFNSHFGHFRNSEPVSIASIAETDETDETDAAEEDRDMSEDGNVQDEINGQSDTSGDHQQQVLQPDHHEDLERDHFRQSMTARNSISDIGFDGRMGWNPRLPPLSEKQSQRWAGQLKPAMRGNSSAQLTSSSQQTQDSEASTKPSSTGSKAPLLKASNRQQSTASSSSASSSATAPPSAAAAAAPAPAAPPIPPRMPRIVKRVSMDQISEHVNPWQGEHMSDHGSISSNEWSSSEYDTSTLSVEKIHKLKKKGINPALYIEMQNARKGKGKWVNPLGGNSFLS